MRLLLKTDLYVLATFLGYTDITMGFHNPLCDWFTTTPFKRNLYMVGRGFFKTSVLSICANIQRILRNPNIRILIASNKAENAEAILSEIKGHLVNPQLIGYFPDIFHADPVKSADVWKTNQIAVKTTQRRREPTITTIGLHGELTGRHYDHGTFDDLVGLENSQTREERQRTIEWWKAAQSILDPGATEDIVGCLPADAEVLMEDGTRKPIDTVKVGDRVWSADTSGSLTACSVTAVVPQGFAKTVTVTTKTRVLRATPNHPFLVHEENGTKLFWQRADELKPGQSIVAIKEIPGKLDYPWMKEEFCWLFGFIIGDGWVSVYDGKKSSRAHVGICMSKDEELNERIVEIASDWLPGPWSQTRLGYIRNDNLQAARGLQELGLVGRAKTKRLPEWAYRLPPLHRRALLRGFCEADGHRLDDTRNADSWRAEIANTPLMEDFRHLASLCGVRTGKLGLRVRYVKPPNSPEIVRCETAQSNFNFAVTSADHREIHHLSPWITPASGLRQDRIVSITSNEIAEPVYDLTVEGSHSFFANGLATHNTPWDFGDLYSYLLNQRASHGMKIGVFRRPCWEQDEQGYDVGPPFGPVRATFPERFPVHESQILRAADGTPLAQQEALLTIRTDAGPTRFAAQYLLEPEDDETAVFPRVKAVVLPRSKFPPLDQLWIVGSVDVATSQKSWADYTANAVVGFDHDNVMWVLHLARARWKESEVIREVYESYARFHPRVIGFETIGFQRLFLHLFQRQAEISGQYLPITKLDRDTKATKNTRIRVLEPFWSAGQIILADDLPALDDFLEEAARFRLTKESTHDDMLDALADCMQLRVRPEGAVAPRIDDPFLAEEIAMEDMIKTERATRKLGPLDASSLRFAVAHMQTVGKMETERQMMVAGAFDDWNVI